MITYTTRLIMPNRKKLKNQATVMGENSKVVITDRKIKEKGSKGKRKIKYDKEGNIKKTVYKVKGKRIVDKPKRIKEKAWLINLETY